MDWRGIGHNAIIFNFKLKFWDLLTVRDEKREKRRPENIPIKSTPP